MVIDFLTCYDVGIEGIGVGKKPVVLTIAVNKA
jgi:hypothetical protein